MSKPPAKDIAPPPPHGNYRYEMGMDYLGHAVDDYGRCKFMDTGTGDPPTAAAQTTYLLAAPNSVNVTLAGILGIVSIITTNAVLVPLIVVAQGL